MEDITGEENVRRTQASGPERVDTTNDKSSDQQTTDYSVTGQRREFFFLPKCCKANAINGENKKNC